MNRPNNATAASFAAALILLSFAFLYNLSYIPLNIWDEARNGNNALQMRYNHQWLVTYYDGHPEMWNTKPPLLIWMQTILMHLIGVNELAVRLPSALAAFATGLLLWQFARKYLQQHWVGFLAVAVLASSFAYVYNHAGRTGDYDTVMILFALSYCYSAFAYTVKQEPRYLLYCWIFLTLATMTKGVAGGLLAPGVVAYLIRHQKIIPALKTRQFWTGAVLFLLVVGSYYFLREQYNPGYLEAVSNNELGGRYLNTLEDHGKPFDFYWTSMRDWLYTYWKWFILPSFIVVYLLGSAKYRKITSFHLYLVIPFFLLISFAQTKIESYVLPVYPILALQIACMFFLVWERINQLFIPLHWKTVAAIALFFLAFTRPYIRSVRQVLYANQGPYDIDPHRPSYYIRDALKKGQDLNGYHFLFDGYNGQVLFYIDKLRYEGVKVELEQRPVGIGKGDKVVVCQVETEQPLLQQFKVKLLEENWGCKVYLVHAPL